METRFRDDALSKNRMVLRVTFIWALVSSISLLIVVIYSFSSFKQQKIRWLPICTSSDFTISETDYSPTYLKEMAKKIIDLRLTYNPETITARYATLVHLTPGYYQEKLTKALDVEIKTVKEKNISSVFYPEKISVDPKHHQALMTGYLHRSSHGLTINPKYKQYKLQFFFQQGELSPIAITEVKP